MSAPTETPDASPPQQLESLLTSLLGARNVSVSGCEPMTGGYNRIMTRFAATIDGETHHLVARTDPPPGVAIVETDRAAEWQIHAALSGAGGPVPEAIAFDPGGGAIGSPTIIMEHISGPGSLLTVARQADESALPGYADGMADLLAEIHSTDLEHLPPGLDRPNSWDDHVDALITAWREAEAEHAERDPFMRYVAAVLDRERPQPAPMTLIHGEFQAANVVLRETGELVAVDWEMARIGDPREDIGWGAGLEAAQPPQLITRDLEAFCARYRERSGLSESVINPQSVVYFSVLGSITGMRLVWRQISSMARGETDSLRAAYLGSYMATLHEGWMEALAL